MTNEELEVKLKEAEENFNKWLADNITMEQARVFIPLLKQYQKHLVVFSVTMALDDLKTRATITPKTLSAPDQPANDDKTPSV